MIGALTFRMRVALIAALAALVAGALTWALVQSHKAGQRKALDAVRRANDAAEQRADEAERQVLACPPGLWNRETRRCATKDLP